MVHHHVLALCSRGEREGKVRYYEKLRPREGAGHYYLYEDYHPAEAPLPRSERFNPDDEVIRMDTLRPENVPSISIKLKSVIQEITVSEMFWLDVEVTNATKEPIYSCPPFPIRLSYHWVQPDTQSMVVFDGERSGVFPSVVANSTRPCKMVIIAPGEAGIYALQVTLVQDGVRWFEEVNPSILQELVITVTEKKKGLPDK